MSTFSAEQCREAIEKLVGALEEAGVEKSEYSLAIRGAHSWARLMEAAEQGARVVAERDCVHGCGPDEMHYDSRNPEGRIDNRYKRRPCGGGERQLILGEESGTVVGVEACLGCGGVVDRDLGEVFEDLEATEVTVMFSEAIAGIALYCGECFDSFEEGA